MSIARRKRVIRDNCYLDITVLYKKQKMLSAYVIIQQRRSVDSKDCDDKIYVSLGAIPALIAALKEVAGV